MTIIEVSVTLGVMLMLASVVFYSTSGIDKWKKGRNAGMDLQSVYLAQKSFLADRPTTDVATIVDSDLLPYMNGATSIPTIETLDGSTKTIDITFLRSRGAAGLDSTIRRIQAEAEQAVDDGFSFIVLSDQCAVQGSRARSESNAFDHT